MAKYNVSKREAKEQGIERVKIGSSSKDKDYSSSDLVDAVLGVTQKEKDPLPTFEEIYTQELQDEDRTQAEELFKPYYEMEIAKQLEDLNAWSEMESIDYERTLRRGRASLAEQGGAIGGERETFQKEAKGEHERSTQNQVRTTEREIGTEKIKEAGYQSGGLFQEGAMVGKMKSDIEGQALWNRNQRSQAYYANAANYYSTPSNETYK